MAVLQNLGGLGLRALQTSLSGAVGKFRPQLASRLMSSKTISAKEKAANPLVQIDETKEDLYHLISTNTEKLGYENLGLLKHLSSHVEPKPNDPTWRFYRRAKMLNSSWIYVGPFFTGIVFMHHYSVGQGEGIHEEADQAGNKQE